MSVPFDCPRCGTVLTMTERAGVEIDYCPQCRGVWLDRGELDKIIERGEAAGASAPAPAPSAAAPPPSAWTAPAPAQQGWSGGGYASGHGGSGHGGGYGGGHGGGHQGKGQYGGHGRRKSWLREIFD